MRTVLFVVFTLSGFSGLVYESIWTHYLKLFLGHAAFAQTLVLAIFMGGMALGSWITGRQSPGWKNLLRGYALTEGVVGLFALGYHPVFVWVLDLAYTKIIPSLGNPHSVTLFKWCLAGVLILPQSVLLGMTFPLMAGGILRRFPQRPGNTLALLYFLNSLGGAAGVLVAGFVLVKHFGLPGTIGTAGTVNVVLAVVVWKLASHETIVASNGDSSSSKSMQQVGGLYYPLLVAALITGASSFIYEIVWIRMISLVLGASTHAFELMLSAFILGLSLGGFWVRKRIDDFSSPLQFLATIQVVMGLLALATLPLYANSFEFMSWLIRTLSKTNTGYALLNLGSHGIAVAVMVPATICAGMTLPLITYILLRIGAGESSIGAVYSSNTLGCILGVIIAFHYGLPLLGLKGSLALGAGMDIGLGLALVCLSLGRSGIRRLLVMGAVSLAIVGFALFGFELMQSDLASGVFRFGELKQEKVWRHLDGKTATIHLTGERNGVLSIRTNGKSDASINMNAKGPTQLDESTMVLAAALPLLLYPQARTAANIGLGSGLTTHVLLSTETLESVDTIEIEPAVVEVAKGFRPRNERVYADPRSRIHIDDAKAFLTTHGKKYDVIISEPSNPWVSGVAGLFSVEFYATVRRYLGERGLFVQWLQLYEFDMNLAFSVLKAIDRSFSDYVIFAPNYGDVLIVATNNSSFPKLDPQLLAVPSLAQELNRIDIRSVQDIELRRIANKQMLEPLLARSSVPANSDYFPFLDLSAVYARFLDRDAKDLLDPASEPIPALEILGAQSPSWSVSLPTPSHHFPVASNAYSAILFRDVATGVSHNPSPSSSPHMKTVKDLVNTCQHLPSGDRVYALFEIALKVIPYLRPQEMDRVWSALETWPCSSNLHPYEQAWLKLFKSIGHRDAPAMANLATSLLRHRQYLTPARMKYLLMAAMLGHLGSQNYEEAFQLWKTYSSELFQTEQPRLLFQIVAAHAAKLGHGKEP